MNENSKEPNTKVTQNEIEETTSSTNATSEIIIPTNSTENAPKKKSKKKLKIIVSIVGVLVIAGIVVSIALASRQAVPGGGSHCGGLRVAQTALWCSSQGCAAELAARALRAPLGQPRRARNEACCARQPCACTPRRHRDRPSRAPPAAKPGGGAPLWAHQHRFCKGVRGPPATRLYSAEQRKGECRRAKRASCFREPTSVARGATPSPRGRRGARPSIG